MSLFLRRLVLLICLIALGFWVENQVYQTLQKRESNTSTKKDGDVRLLILGGSISRGYGRFLEHRLQQLLPEKKIFTKTVTTDHFRADQAKEIIEKENFLANRNYILLMVYPHSKWAQESNISIFSLSSIKGFISDFLSFLGWRAKTPNPKSKVQDLYEKNDEQQWQKYFSDVISDYINRGLFSEFVAKAEAPFYFLNEKEVGVDELSRFKKIFHVAEKSVRQSFLREKKYGSHYFRLIEAQNIVSEFVHSKRNEFQRKHSEELLSDNWDSKESLKKENLYVQTIVSFSDFEDTRLSSKAGVHRRLLKTALLKLDTLFFQAEREKYSSCKKISEDEYHKMTDMSVICAMASSYSSKDRKYPTVDESGLLELPLIAWIVYDFVHRQGFVEKGRIKSELFNLYVDIYSRWKEQGDEHAERLKSSRVLLSPPEDYKKDILEAYEYAKSNGNQVVFVQPPNADFELLNQLSMEHGWPIISSRGLFDERIRNMNRNTFFLDKVYVDKGEVFSGHLSTAGNKVFGEHVAEKFYELFFQSREK